MALHGTDVVIMQKKRGTSFSVYLFLYSMYPQRPFVVLGFPRVWRAFGSQHFCAYAAPLPVNTLVAVA